MAINFRREIGRNRRYAFLLGTHIRQRMEDWKADGRVNSAEVLPTSYKNLVNVGPLTPEFTVMVWRPFMRQMHEIVETHSILGTRILQRMAGTAEMICAKFTRKTCLVTRNKKRVVHSEHPRSIDGMECPRSR